MFTVTELCKDIDQNLEKNEEILRSDQLDDQI